MSWNIESVTTVTGTLTATTPLHVGGNGGEGPADQPLVLDGTGRPFLPGTSLAGVLRHWCARHLDDAGLRVAEVLFGGPVVPAGGRSRTEQRDPASRLRVADAPLSPECAATTEVRHHVAIDRHTGAAAPGVLFETEVLPTGSGFDLRLVLEAGRSGSVTADEQVELLDLLVLALVDGDVRVGGGTTRGLGAVRLVAPEACRTPWGPAPVADLVRDTLAGAAVAAPWTAPSAGLRWLRPDVADLDLEVGWEAVSAVLVQSGDSCDAIDSLPLMTGVPAGLAPVVPGSSVKGVLRDTAERIVRTVLGDTGPSPATTISASAIAQRSVPLVDVVFGSASDDRDDSSSAGLLGVDDCVALGPVVTVDDWAKVLTLTKPAPGCAGSEVRAALDAVRPQPATTGSAVTLATWEWRHHVAVDRWSGAAADGHLYTELEPWGVDWPPLRVTLRRGHLDPLDAPTWHAAVTLVGLVLEEMAQGRLRFGHGGGRGLGEVRLTSLDPRRRTDGTAPTQLSGPVLDRLAELVGMSRDDLVDAWSDWVQQHRDGASRQTAQPDPEEAR